MNNDTATEGSDTREELIARYADGKPIRVNGDYAVKLSDVEAYAQAKANEAVAETAKAYGGCTKCYGKGYATVKSQQLGYGTDGDIGGFEGKFKVDMPVKMNYCDCERGNQLSGLLAAKEEQSK